MEGARAAADEQGVRDAAKGVAGNLRGGRGKLENALQGMMLQVGWQRTRRGDKYNVAQRAVSCCTVTAMLLCIASRTAHPLSLPQLS